jgi:TRAP-type C4-dicarboxylate transport system permease small subunit
MKAPIALPSAATVLSRLSDALGWVVNTSALGAAGIVVILMGLVTADVTGRYLFNAPVPMTYEVGAFMLVFIVFLGLAYSQRQRAHIRVEFVTLRLPPKARGVLDLLAYTLGIAVYGAIFYQGFTWAYHGFQIGEYVAGLIDIPKWPSMFAVPFGAMLLGLQFLSDWINRFVQVLALFREEGLAVAEPVPAGDSDD